jgi:small subunit ribosomal protein S11
VDFVEAKKAQHMLLRLLPRKQLIKQSNNIQFSKADVFIKGIGLGRESAVRAMAASGVAVESIKDVTGVPHGGCRPKKG